MKYTVYKWSNKQNGKVYIGQTAYDLSQRISAHVCAAKFGSRYKFHQALRKYGVEGFNIEIIDVSDNHTDCVRLERHYIKEHDSYRNGYNMTEGGEGTPCSPEKALKISEAKKGKSLPHMVGNNYACRLMWVTNGTDNLRIKLSDLIPEGYRRGRFNTPGPRLNGTKRPKFSNGYQSSSKS